MTKPTAQTMRARRPPPARTVAATLFIISSLAPGNRRSNGRDLVKCHLKSRTAPVSWRSPSPKTPRLQRGLVKVDQKYRSYEKHQ
jgi:hypothetical protein